MNKYTVWILAAALLFAFYISDNGQNMPPAADPVQAESAAEAEPAKTADVSAGNRYSQSMRDVQRIMPQRIYYDHMRTLYCDAEFDRRRRVSLPGGFTLPDINNVDFKVYDITPAELQQRAHRMEWEHIVPAENFGRTFSAWKYGGEGCVYGNGHRYRGRSCAVKASEEFRYMYTDMYNLYPSVGAVNYLRSNFSFTQFGSSVPATFGSCNMKISRNKAEPRDEVKGLIARTYFYMQRTYPRYRIGEPAKSVLRGWAEKYPVTKWECVRALRIEKLQGNADTVVKRDCIKKGFYVDR